MITNIIMKNFMTPITTITITTITNIIMIMIIFSANSTFITLHLHRWPDGGLFINDIIQILTTTTLVSGLDFFLYVCDDYDEMIGCPIHYYVIEYKEEAQPTWRIVSNNIRSEEESIIIRFLSSLTCLLS